MNAQRMRLKTALYALFCFLFIGCAGLDRSCSSACAESFGGDWVVVQMDCSGKPFRCWELHNVSIVNESGSDGIYWKDTASSNLVHISGFYNRVQVMGGRWEAAFTELGLSRQACTVIHATPYVPGGPANTE